MAGTAVVSRAITHLEIYPYWLFRTYHELNSTVESVWFTAMTSTQFSHLTQTELKAALLTRLNIAAKLRKESRQLREHQRDLGSKLFAIECEVRRIQKVLGVKIIWREKK